jgi:hypothetical protein
MSDLISRKTLIKVMEKKYDIAEATGMYPTGLSEAFIITEKIIKEQPTACDADKVVEQLENLKKCYIGDENAIMKLVSFDEYIQEIIDMAKGSVKDE